MTESAQDGGRKAWLRYAYLTVPAIVILGSLSGWLSNSGYGNDWFDDLQKPVFMPPGWTFGLVWTLLYVLLGLSLALILAEPQTDRRRNGLILFFVQLILNYSWSPIFFAAHDIRAALVVIFVMLATAAATAGQFFRIRPLAGALMVPYLAWLCFAAALTMAIDRLNPGTGVPLLG